MDVVPRPTRTVSPPPTIASLWAEVSGDEMTDATLEWPADVFALVGSVLGRTHAYRFAVSPPAGLHWPPGGAASWNSTVCGAAESWAAWAEAPEGPPPALVADAWAVLRDGASATLDDIADGRNWAVCEALLTLLAASDETCAGVAAALDPVRESGYRFRARADELLSRTGSLSLLPTHRLRVLPKVRTPPGGISFRSLSRYLCIRGPSVDVAWHKVPARRSGLGQQQANVLLMPWPLRVRQRDFRPLPGSVHRAENEPFGVFEFAPTEGFDLDLVERTLRGALDEVDGVDAVIFPESCVPVGDIEPLEALLAHYGVTVLLAGARETTTTPGRLPANWLHQGVHVGGCWAHYRQNKHHRWFLDESQINQYHLAGALHPSVRWWEAMEVPRRSLQFLELSEGLTLVTVVCEDLARMDEVAELIRDVGPTLVVTVLLDGPQLATRWTARYAGVLADDPGTAVLTLTAHGMVERSRPTGMPPSTVVALWKDPTRGLREISLEPGATGVLISLAATRARRRVADGRTPVDNATGLMVAGVFPVAPAQEVVPHAGGERTVTGAALDAPDLTIVTAWSDAVAEALEHAPEQVDALVDDARPGTPWRRDLGLPEPSEPLAEALTAVADIVEAVQPGGKVPRDAAILALLQTASADGPAAASLARAVLRSALEARQDARAVISRHG
ncbi:hypothetical protein [Blastococcus sp. CT_GayMR16]|uniref:hypothetical protein n=1 Tax=Blastococcus sp. CT_GayMR16 TaxID=2559607 RepID=UPI001074211D|nr:hypothetical protein [Blastococcus sp. CT_GayMR16]TFV89796.1 hypothetical protein E4P38_04850 [Blastococcus sp. CT_GayMR16]